MQLLHAAVQAGTYDGFKLLTKIPAMANIISEDVMQLLRAAFQAQLWRHHSVEASQIVVDVGKLEASSGLGTAELTELLVAAASLELSSSAVVEEYDAAVSALCVLKLRDRPHLSSEQLFTALHMAVQHANDRCVRCVCMHPLLATQLLSSEQVDQLLNVAVENNRADCLFQLSLSVVEVQLTYDQVVSAMMAAVEKNMAACLELLCKLQAVYLEELEE
jgi:hypothetical protein